MDDIRSIVEEFEAYCRQREKELRKIYPGFEIKTIENHPPVPHLDTGANDDVVDLIKRLSGNSKLDTVSFAAEAGQFANEGFQSAICGPGSIAQAHRADEFITKEQLEKGVQFMEKLILELSSESFE